jgi:uncharacterized protein with GYD domain
MATFIMFGKYSSESVKEMSAKRTDKAVSLMKKFDGKMNAMYALLGQHDLVFIADFPGVKEAMKASVAISKLTGISFTTSPAVKIEEFDKMMADL